MVLFVGRAGMQSLQDVLRLAWLSEYSTEAGASEHRCKVIPINPEHGSATGYVAKYVSKNIDGAGDIGDAASDEAPELNGRDNARRVARLGERSRHPAISTGGRPAVGMWRELRRLREPVPELGFIEAARAAADAGRWRDFIGAVCMRGIESGRRMVIGYDRGEAPQPGLFQLPRRQLAESNCYGEPRRPPVIGLQEMDGAVITRPHRWRIERKCASHGVGGVKDGTSASAAAGRTAPCSSSGSERSGSEFFARRAIHSDLGPVAITVRGAVPPPDGEFAWVMTVPYRSMGDPTGWTSRETSMAGPN